MKRSLALLAAAVLCAAVGGQQASASAGIAFGTPVRVTPDGGGGYEPATVIDHFGNIFVTAHKENFELALSPDPQSPTSTRSMSWKWMSSDGGATFKEIPGLPLNAENHQFGDEGDLWLSTTPTTCTSSIPKSPITRSLAGRSAAATE
ncbi:MAG: hypothetical protein ABR548_09185 [Actinomycetota bacterium]|nr:hypothetical protein [Actinomycetota bacterium]